MQKILRRCRRLLSFPLSSFHRSTETKRTLHSHFPLMEKPAVSPAALTKSGQALAKLQEFGYAFNDDGELRKIDKETGKAGKEPFEFDVFQDQAKNQAHYEKLADQIPEIVYDLLEQNGMSRFYVPMDVPKEEATFVFMHPEKLIKPKKLLILIHGSGFVRAGQWARSLIINNSLNHGTQLPYIKKAQELGYSIIVTNTNDNYRIINGMRKPIPGLSTATLHATYVWENLVMSSGVESVAIVAHSAGGSVTLDLVKRFPTFFKEKVFAIAFTDSAHFGISETVKSIIGQKTCNWVSCNDPLDTPIATDSDSNSIRVVSAGHPKHEWSSFSAMDSVFKYLEEKYKAFV